MIGKGRKHVYTFTCETQTGNKRKNRWTFVVQRKRTSRCRKYVATRLWERPRGGGGAKLRDVRACRGGSELRDTLIHAGIWLLPTNVCRGIEASEVEINASVASGGRAGGTYWLLALVILTITTHPFRDGAPFLHLGRLLPFFFILRPIGQNTAQAHHTYYVVSI